MRRTSFAGALIAVAIGAVLAFAIHGSPKDLDVQTIGLILVVAGVADLLIRSLIADSPLLSPQTADVAAVLDPIGEPVLDAQGNVINVPNTGMGGRPPLIAPLPGTMPPGSVHDTIVVTDDAVLRVPAGGPVTTAVPARDLGDPEYRAYTAAVRAEAGDPFDTPESAVAVTSLSGRPIRPRGRGFGGARRRSWR